MLPSENPHVDALPPGLYELLLSRTADRALPAGAEAGSLDPEDAHAAVAQHLERLIAASLSRLRGRDHADRQRRLVDRLIAALTEELGSEGAGAETLSLSDPLRRLLAVHAPGSSPPPRPDTPLARSALLTGTRLDPSLGSQLAKEIGSADRIDILCSFIRWSGLRILLGPLHALTARGPVDDGTGIPRPRLRVLTTSYMGATDPKAVEALAALPATEVRVSYDTQATRLHAKAYIAHRDTGFGSAYVGSANMSRAALHEGLEWTTKISQYELAYLWDKLAGSYETWWNDPEFEPFDASRAPRLRAAIDRERRGTGVGADIETATVSFDLSPHPFQQEILDALAAEREVQNKSRHLVVAATGTGKTMVAAFDYRAWSATASAGGRPSLLFVAHREEILRQALGTFRGVLRDQNFGDLLVGGATPDRTDHLFCSIQTYNSRELWREAPERWRYIVLDEAHHGSAASYRRLIEHVRPEVLLGLTATPERADGRSIFEDFGGEPTAEVRLPDAIGRRLLVPFQYFGVADAVDLDTLTWQRGGYRTEDLDAVYTGNDIRAQLVIDKCRELLLDPREARGLGFCVSVRHAEYMAAFFTARGLPSLSLSAETPAEERRAARRRLVDRDVSFIFVVDLYNEGVDIPEIDTVLFLRPTESLTVYLQQLGRGLRKHDDKDFLTVLDFIGAQNRQFCFARRLRALTADPTRRVDREIEEGFPHLPPGCTMQLERVAQQRVLENVRQSLNLRRPQMVAELEQLGRHLQSIQKRLPTLTEAMDYLDVSLPGLLRRGLWSRLLADARLIDAFDELDEARLAKGLLRLAHTDDPLQIRFVLEHLRRPRRPADLDDLSRRRLAMLHLSLWGGEGAGWTLDEAEDRLRANPRALDDLQTLLEHRLAHTRVLPRPLEAGRSGPLLLHAEYTRDEILAGLGHWRLDHRPDHREGPLHLPGPKVDALFITLHKTEDAYSPSTMYEDYAISESLFHWQSQNRIHDATETGRRYIRHREMGYTPLLFVREHKSSEQYGPQAAPYAFLGPADYVSHTGARPMSIIWRLRTPMPARLVRTTARQAAG